MAARHYQIDVGTSAIELTGTEYPGYMLRNLSGVTIYLGDSTVLTTTGFPVDAGMYFSPGEVAHTQLSEQTRGLRIYAIAGTVSNDVRIFVPGRAD